MSNPTPTAPTSEKTETAMKITAVSTGSTAMSGNHEAHLINEALSRSRTRSPQTTHSEARRSARRIAIEARRQQARELGNLSLYGVR
jgi:hypothetical protein